MQLKIKETEAGADNQYFRFVVKKLIPTVISWTLFCRLWAL